MDTVYAPALMACLGLVVMVLVVVACRLWPALGGGQVRCVATGLSAIAAVIEWQFGLAEWLGLEPTESLAAVAANAAYIAVSAMGLYEATNHNLGRVAQWVLKLLLEGRQTVKTAAASGATAADTAAAVVARIAADPALQAAIAAGAGAQAPPDSPEAVVLDPAGQI